MPAKTLVVIVTVLVVLSTVPIARIMGVSLIPRDDQSEYEVHVITPEGYSLDRTDKIMVELENRLWKLPGTEHVFTTIGSINRNAKGQGTVTKGTIHVRMKDLTESQPHFEWPDPYGAKAVFTVRSSGSFCTFKIHRHR